MKKFKNRESALWGKSTFVAVKIGAMKDQKQCKCPIVGLSEL